MQPFMVRDTINVKLIRYLDNHPGSNLIFKIAADLGVDRHTVTTHLDELETLITAHFKASDLQLSVDANGVSLQRSAKVNLDRVMSFLTKESLMTKLIRSTFEQTADSLGDFSEKYFSSLSTAKRHVKKMQTHVALYGLRYSPANNVLVGPEAMIRLCYYRVYWETYSRFEWPFDHVDQQEIVRQLTQWTDQLGIYLDDITRQQLSYWLVICQQRQRVGALIKLPQVVTQATIRQQPITELPGIFDAQMADENEFFDYCLLFFTHYLTPDALKPTGVVARGSDLALNELQARFGQLHDETQKARLLSSLNVLHTYTLIFTVGGLLLDRAGIADKLVTKRPWVIEAVSQVLMKLRATGNPVFDNLTYLSAQYVTVVLTYFDTTPLNPTLKIQLMIDATPSYREWLLKQLRDYLKDKYHVVLVSDDEPCDLLITNFAIETAKPVIVINTPITKQDWGHLQQFTR
ncbi:hypothetical protein IWT25_02473 [Secundilactobacillus pentosiphilus]|uniref:Mga helix-turn-helix domain-containing protein n=1 Tax=Secundilactobacillus pentosiphilus TaxID=1714682 RepID=A0A1Z5IZB7_9LACO|nr:helix-turn-helix domain-containing protein [Secundilactobacillus pentosiphilus]GAX07125.1 hypothetical protein IWT25_02473 [Secundilactobacillus pentosiphilus]